MRGLDRLPHVEVALAEASVSTTFPPRCRAVTTGPTSALAEISLDRCVRSMGCWTLLGVRSSTSPAEHRFSQLWDSYARRVLAYASRHTDPAGVQDVVAETFLVAWRRLDDVPEDPLPWLLVVARNTAANRRRSIYRARVVELEMARVARLARASEAADVPVHARADVLRAMGQLTATEREALFLTAWDGLAPAQGAQVVGCSVDAFTKRVSRARARLSAAVAEDANDDDVDGMTLRSAR